MIEIALFGNHISGRCRPLFAFAGFGFAGLAELLGNGSLETGAIDRHTDLTR